MTGAKRQMALTADLVAAAARVVEDRGPSSGAVYMTEQDYEITIRDTLAKGSPGDVWLFAYGSLLWKPACEVAESRRAIVYGWHRAFCIRIARFRGTPERNGLMMALDRGGQCHGMIFRLPAARLHENLDKLFRREMVIKTSSNVPRWVTGRVVYVRFHGSRKGLRRGYPDRVLDEWADWLDREPKRERERYAFFNNDAEGHAVRDAERLRARLGRP